MRKRLESVLALGTALIASTAAARRGGDERRTPRLRFTARISDRASVPAGAIAKAKSTAGHVFDAIGVEALWIDCPPGGQESRECGEPPRATHLFVMIVPRATLAPAHRLAVCGLAVLPESGRGSHLYVFHDRVEALAAEHLELSAGAILGHVVAHEIGHLLLGSGSHGREGLMAGRWFGRDLRRLSRGDLLFVAAETMRLRAELAVRMSEEQTAGVSSSP
jgi:hypothetical protein